MIWGFLGGGTFYEVPSNILYEFWQRGRGGHCAVPHLEDTFSIYDGALKYFFWSIKFELDNINVLDSLKVFFSFSNVTWEFLACKTQWKNYQKMFKGTVVNPKLSFLHRGLLEFKLTGPSCIDYTFNMQSSFYKKEFTSLSADY